MTRSLPNGVLLAFYGDDFTGSTDAMEVTALAGLKTVLFTATPDDAALERFKDYPVVGIAGTARSKGPDWMEAHLPAVFERLAALQPRLIQYKVCSTFDSSPETGSIGKAIDIGCGVCEATWAPSIVGAPHLGRWQVFGNLFAATGGEHFRIDRHPSMSRHPVTPMTEGDLTRHLAKQTERAIVSIDVAMMASGHADAAADKALSEGSVAFIDVVHDASQEEAGRLVWQRANGKVFSASSSGLQYALVAHWRADGILSSRAPAFPPVAPVEKLLVLSGSCSVVTAQQIERAEKAGFASIRLDVLAAADPDRVAGEIERIGRDVRAAFEDHDGVLVYAARTVDDPAFANLQKEYGSDRETFTKAQDDIGLALGRLAADLVPRLDLRRIVVAGGDTAGRVLETVPVTALEVAHPLGKGAPICRCHGSKPAFDGLQVVLKGGQLGGPDLFVEALRGAEPAPNPRQ
ncbi:four-carbon acid sugar kinase family protein [Fulvimarina endophytica]|uniref:Four-carbon acid sugar kinase family protein n=1 Tax=Fulvimarina endophytica TaxID=2293836 RepID=A0A371X0I7_9HYPH|nr:four-carbon acid sugar kinase family protein [Fulvimarina endophytica]RFC62753.1 four-carbon acid sugar kinase family protein [Fulvimarina endophytica]